MFFFLNITCSHVVFLPIATTLFFGCLGVTNKFMYGNLKKTTTEKLTFGLLRQLSFFVNCAHIPNIFILYLISFCSTWANKLNKTHVLNNSVIIHAYNNSVNEAQREAIDWRWRSLPKFKGQQNISWECRLVLAACVWNFTNDLNKLLKQENPHTFILCHKMTTKVIWPSHNNSKISLDIPDIFWAP